MATKKLLIDAQAAVERCELCQLEEACFFCKDCQQEICTSCKTTHLRSKVSRNHKVIDIAADFGTEDGNRSIENSNKCSKHFRESIQMYCINCKVPVCHTCIAEVDHENHRFEKLENVLESYQKEIEQYISETKQQISELEMSLGCIDVNAKDYTKQSDETIKGINKQRKQIKSQVDRIADGLVEQVEERKVQDLQLMEKERKEIQKAISGQIEFQRSCEEKLKSMRDIIKFDFSTYATYQMTKSISYPPSITNIHPPTFSSAVAIDLQDIFGRLMDRLEQKATQRESADQTKNIIDETLVTNCTDVIADINFHGLGIRCVSTVNDKKAWCCEGNDIVFMHIDGHIKKKIQLDFDVWDIAATPSGKLLVTKGSNIMKCSQNGRCINLCTTKPYETQGLCLTSKQDILVSLYNYDSGENKVVRMNKAGHIKQTIQTDKHHQQLFTDPWFVKENINGDVCIVDRNVDLDFSLIAVVNNKGELRFRYPESDQSPHTIRSCYGIACDNLGFIFISDYYNSRIHQIDRDGKFIGFVLTVQHGIQEPRGLSTDTKGQLWVCNDSDKVRIVKYKS